MQPRNAADILFQLNMQTRPGMGKHMNRPRLMLSPVLDNGLNDGVSHIITSVLPEKNFGNSIRIVVTRQNRYRRGGLDTG